MGKVQPVAIQMMDEVQMDLRTHRSKGVADLPHRRWDYVVTMGCGDACPTLDARRRVDWDVPDPVGLPLNEVRRVRDGIMESVHQLIKAHKDPTAKPG